MHKKILDFLFKVKKLYMTSKLHLYYTIDKDYVRSLDISKAADTLLLTIAFNNVEVIKLQIEKIRLFCQDNYCLLIADNSTDEETRRKIAELCKKEGVLYYPLPKQNPFNGYDPSASHGAALNYVWKNVVQNLDDIRYVMLLDHDIFPSEVFSVNKMLGNASFYGLIKERELGWYLWPGFSCFDKYKINKGMNFLPSKYGDTGSAIYPRLYAKYDVKDIRRASDVYVDLYMKSEHDNTDDMYVDQRNRIEIIDETWIHMINAADWAGVGGMEKKFAEMMQWCKRQNGGNTE